MEILDAVDVPTGIHGEGDPIQAAMAHHTGEAVGMVGLPGGSENPFHDGLRTDTALLQCVLQIKRTQPHVSAISARHCSFCSQEHESVMEPMLLRAVPPYCPAWMTFCS